MPPFIPRPLALLFIVLGPGILGTMGACELCGIGVCSFVPLTPTALVLPACVAVATILFSRWCDLGWGLAPAVYSLPMLAPIGISATSLAEEWPRLVLATLCVTSTWVGARMVQQKRTLPKKPVPTTVAS